MHNNIHKRIRKLGELVAKVVVVGRSLLLFQVVEQVVQSPLSLFVLLLLPPILQPTIMIEILQIIQPLVVLVQKLSCIF